MTREEAERHIKKQAGVIYCFVWGDSGIDLDLECAKASDLRAIADILDQVGKEDGKAGEG